MTSFGEQVILSAVYEMPRARPKHIMQQFIATRQNPMFQTGQTFIKISFSTFRVPRNTLNIPKTLNTKVSGLRTAERRMEAAHSEVQCVERLASVNTTSLA